MRCLSVIPILASLGMLTAAQRCPECDPNEYKPVCSSGQAFYSLCNLMRQKCLGNVVTDGAYHPCGDADFQERSKPTPIGLPLLLVTFLQFCITLLRTILLD